MFKRPISVLIAFIIQQGLLSSRGAALIEEGFETTHRLLFYSAEHIDS
jgi:hypothetical protein